MTTKSGRGRFYGITPLEGFTSRSFAMSAAWMDEMRERVFDQIEDLGPEALDFEARGTGLTIGKLGIHLAWAENLMMGRITQGETPDDLAALLAPGALATMGQRLEKSPPASEIIAISRRVRDEITVPGLKNRNDPDEVCTEDGSTPRGIIDQLLWHWVYHSGQIGLIRFEWGSDYQWTFNGPLAPDPC